MTVMPESPYVGKMVAAQGSGWCEIRMIGFEIILIWHRYPAACCRV
jgi:hypothetical protein